MRKIGVYLADTHGGHCLGLMNPGTELYDGEHWYNPPMSTTQKYLWGKYMSHREAVWGFADDSPVHVFHCGDECHGDKHPEQLVSTRIGDQLVIAQSNVTPWLDEGATSLRMEQGTGAHDFGEASSTLVITGNLRKQYPDRDVDMIKHGIANFDGLRIDYAHHGPHPGSRKWTEGNSLRYYVKDRMLNDILHGREPCQMFIRAHYHTYIHETVEIKGHKTWRCEAWILPSFCGLSDYGMQATRSIDSIDIGMLAFAMGDGELIDTLTLVEYLDLRIEESF